MKYFLTEWHGFLEKKKATYAEFYFRCKSLAIATKALNIRKGEVVSVMLPNVPQMIEAHFGIPMSGAILNSINKLAPDLVINLGAYTHVDLAEEEKDKANRINLK